MNQEDSIKHSIQKIKTKRVQVPSVHDLTERVKSNDLVALSKAITLIESTNKEKRALGLDVLDALMPYTGNSIRIGITGVPGVGKSTFIEAFGLYLIEQGKKIAVLAIDPSSQNTGGSILGDKTRMEQLSVHPKAFIRPSPAGDALGGVADNTRESILLCEAAGFDVILVETVGVGQSETLVHSMTDFFLLLMLAGAGDDLQGIKRGIMEMADHIGINKSDGDNVNKAKSAKSAYASAIHLFPPKENNWTTEVSLLSGLHGEGMDEVWGQISRFQVETKAHFEVNRKRQITAWFKAGLKNEILDHILTQTGNHELIVHLEAKVSNGTISPHSAIKQLITSLG